MSRHVHVIGLRPEHRDRYLELHAAVWPEIVAMIRACGISNYSIHLHGDLLIGVFDYEGFDYERDMAKMAADPRTNEWWELTLPCQMPLPGSTESSPWLSVPLVWSLD